jgi:hypothetical protein
MANKQTGNKPGITPACDPKRLANLKALAALAGHTLNQVSSGGYVLSRWTHSRHFDNLDTAEALLAQMGVKHG